PSFPTRPSSELPRRRGLHRGHPLELREVPGRPGRHGGGPVQAPDHPAGAGTGGGGGEGAAALTRTDGPVVAPPGSPRVSHPPRICHTGPHRRRHGPPAAGHRSPTAVTAEPPAADPT